MKRLGIFLGFSVCILLAACQGIYPQNPTQPWRYADLRALDPAEEIPPDQDLLAIYQRQVNAVIQFRLDFLKLNELPEADLYLALDTTSGGATQLPFSSQTDILWDTLIIMPASGSIKVQGWDPLKNQAYPRLNSGAWILRDPIQDAVIINIHLTVLGSLGVADRFQIFITPADNPTVTEKTEPISFEAPPPPPAQVLLTFWDCLPAYTPSQALRRWDGAHTGPLGGRHGLFNLLRTARNAGVPFVLMDLNTPASLSALDYVGGLGLVKDIAQTRLLSLPTPLPALGFSPSMDSLPALPDWAIQRLVDESRQVTVNFGIPAQPFLFIPASFPFFMRSSDLSLPKTAALILTDSSTNESSPEGNALPWTVIQRWQDHRILPLPMQDIATHSGQQVSLSGPSLDLRRDLIATALAQNGDPDSNPILVIGGSLPNSTWGNPQIARAAFYYLNTHPWIRLLNLQDLLAYSPSEAAPSPNPQARATQPGLDQFEVFSQSATNILQRDAWLTLWGLYQPAPPAPRDALAELRSNFLDEVNLIHIATAWAMNPVQASGCTAGKVASVPATCVLSSPDFLALIDQRSGMLRYAFGRTQDGSDHQLIGPSTQLTSGLGDPAEWNLSRGLSADPLSIPGAFINPEMPARLEAGDGYLDFVYPDGGHLVYSLLNSGLRVEGRNYPADQAVSLQLPLLLDPWMRFSPGWATLFQFEQDAQGWSIWITNDLRVQIRSDLALSLQSFTSSRLLLDMPEDPNIDYPAGHRLPFPLILLEAPLQADWFIEIELLPR